MSAPEAALSATWTEHVTLAGDLPATVTVTARNDDPAVIVEVAEETFGTTPMRIALADQTQTQRLAQVLSAAAGAWGNKDADPSAHFWGCAYCGKKFSSADGVDSHIDTAHPDLGMGPS